MSKKRLICVAGTALASLALSATASGDSSKDSKIVMDPDPPTYLGVVISTSKNCLEGRKVKVLRVTKGRDEVLGRDLTDKDGVWGVPVTPKPGNTYYAKVKRQSETNGVFCAGDRSNRVKT
jgi:hypothetical protein